jgi:hypothetical protein
MSQTRKGSLAEACMNVAIGYFVALLAQGAIFPLFGFYASTAQHAAIGALFTIVSLVRSYCLRRLFNWISSK